MDINYKVAYSKLQNHAQATRITNAASNMNLLYNKIDPKSGALGNSDPRFVIQKYKKTNAGSMISNPANSFIRD